jgi:dihydrolipoamide dehydrogenase
MRESKIAIIGGGPGGYVAAIRAAQLGASVLLVEKEKLGGVCLHQGCIPTKALARGVQFLNLVEKSKEYGFSFTNTGLDFAKMQNQKDRVVASLVKGLSQLMVSNRVDVVYGVGKLCSPNEIEIETGEGVELVRAEKVLLAPGSVPQLPGISVVGKRRILTSADILQLSTLPSSLLIIGGGVVGVEFATIFAPLGVRVTLIEKEPYLIPGEDTEVTMALKYLLEKQGITVLTDCQVIEINGDDDSPSTITINTMNEVRQLSAELVLATTGRRPKIDNLGLNEVGIATGREGIAVNEMMETNIAGVYAAGDAVGGKMLAHVASREGIVAVENALGRQVVMDYRAVPRCVYSSTEVAAVGMTENEARAMCYQVAIGRFPLAANGMGSILRESGFIKVVADLRDGKVLGVHILAPHASELIGEATLAMKLGAGIKEISDTIHAHPTLSEGLMEAALDAAGEAIHIRPRGRIAV